MLLFETLTNNWYIYTKYMFLVSAYMRVQTQILNEGVSHQNNMEGFPGGTVVKNPPVNAGDTGSSPGPGRSRMLQSN